MFKDFLKNNKRYFITVAIGLAVATVVCIYRGLLSPENDGQVLLILSDACAVSGIILTGVGLLVMVSNQGLFNGISYGLKSAVKALSGRPDGRDGKMEEDFYEYNARKLSDKVRFGHMVAVGAAFIIFSIIFAVIL